MSPGLLLQALRRTWVRISISSKLNALNGDVAELWNFGDVCRPEFLEFGAETLDMMETRWSPVDEPAAGSSGTVLWKLVWAELPVWCWW